METTANASLGGSSMHHSFDIHLAEIYGIKESTIIHHFQHWISLNKTLGRNQHEGRTWSCQTIKEIAAHFPYMTESEIYEIIEKLCRGKGRRAKNQEFDPVLVKGNFNKSKYDHTTWYAFENEELLEYYLNDPPSDKRSWKMQKTMTNVK